MFDRMKSPRSNKVTHCTNFRSQSNDFDRAKQGSMTAFGRKDTLCDGLRPTSDDTIGPQRVI